MASFPGENVCGTKAGKRAKSKPVSSVLKLSSVRRMWVVIRVFEQGSSSRLCRVVDKIQVQVVIDVVGR